MYIVVVLKIIRKFFKNLCKNDIGDVKWLENVDDIIFKYGIVVLNIY